MAADILLIYITWTKLSSWGASRDIRQKRVSLSDILFRGGKSLRRHWYVRGARSVLANYPFCGVHRNHIFHVRPTSV